ncbi:hypothetical protein [Novosphingobium ginsenosidimutans]|uniref:hypothetical protein n=1 Tax=Novosphingobium ginsenosidimutans TaxID=1176536 RepID=UPI001375FBF3|nr:hypothetical protein [Novosphingobium ginsenosidimutans]
MALRQRLFARLAALFPARRAATDSASLNAPSLAPSQRMGSYASPWNIFRLRPRERTRS